MKAMILKMAMVVFVVLAIGATGSLAQLSKTDELAQLRADITADRQALVTINLGLTDAEGAAFWPVYREYRSEMAKAGDRLQKVILDYAKIFESATPEQARTTVDEVLAFQRDELKVRETYLPRFRKVIPEIKVARFLQIENKMDAVMRVELADAIPLIRGGSK